MTARKIDASAAQLFWRDGGSISCRPWLYFRIAPAQADYPFRDPKLSDDQRIADLLGRLTLDEKVNLMSDHPKFPRLGLVFSGQVEGLHGLALGGPGGVGRTRPPASADNHLSSGKRPGSDVGPGLLKKIASLEGYEARYDYQKPDLRSWRGRCPRAQRRLEPRSRAGAAPRSRMAKTRFSSAPSPWPLRKACRAPIQSTGRRLR
jgi:hypothetical protein